MGEFSDLAIALAVASAALVSRSALADNPEEVQGAAPLRKAMPIQLGLNGTWLFSRDGGSAIPIPGVMFAYNVTPHVAIDARLHTLGPVMPMVFELGARGFLLKSTATPYVYNRTGVGLLRGFGGDDVWFGVINSGVGLEATSSGGFNLDIEIGPTLLMTDGGAAVVGHGGFDIGGRF